MDHEYIQHIKGSPYIKEGMWDRFKAKAAQQMGSLGAMAGHQIQDPNEAKIRSLWDGFMKNLKSIMKDWDSQVAPMFDGQVPLDQNGETIKSAIDTLSRSLRPEYPTAVDKYHPSLGYHADPGVRNPRDNPDSYVKGSAYNRSTTSPSKLKDLAPKQPGYDIEEGFWDAANRDLKLNKALGSNDPSQILNAYKKYILNLFNGFMKDAMKTTKLQAAQIYQLLAKMKATSHMQKVVQALKQLQSAGEANPQAEPGEAPPVIQQPAAQPPPIPQQPAPYSGPVPPVIGQNPPPVPPQSKKDHLPADPTPSEYDPPVPGQQSGQKFNITPQEMPYVILKAIRIIIDAVSSDKSHVGKYFTAPNMPTNFQQDISEIKSPPKSNKPKDQSKNSDEDNVFEPIKGEFVYNFHGNYRKSPTQNFSIQVEPVKESPEVEQVPGLSIQVWWSCTDTENEIYAVGFREGAQTDPVPIMEFSDHETSSKMGAATKYDPNEFSVEKIVNNSNDPGTAPKLDPQKHAEAFGQIKKLQNLLLRSLMVVTARKAKEFKPKTKDIIPITYDEQGTISYIDPDTKKESTMTLDQVKKVLKGDYQVAKKWKDTLEYHDYLKKFPIQIISPEEYPSWKEAETELMTQYGQNDSGARKILVAAWDAVSKNKPQDQITADDLLATWSGYKPQQSTPPAPPPPPPAPPQSQKITWSKDGTVKVKDVNGNVLPIPKDKVGDLDDKTKTELEKAGYFKAFPPTSGNTPKSPPEPPKTPPAAPSAPAGGPAPSAPVSGPAGGPAPTTNPTAPVSDKGKEDAKAGAKPSETPSGDTEKPEKTFWLDDDGSIMMMGKSGQHPLSLAQANALAKKNPKIGAKFKADGIDLDKMNADSQAKSQGQPAQKKPKKKLKEDLDDNTVNPFQLSNFL